jgi:hypothetical protein
MRDILRRFLIAILILNAGFSLRAQNEIDYEAEGGLVQFNIFHFEGTKKYEQILTVTEEMDNINIMIKSYISLGELSIEIIDPAGEKQGSFSVQGDKGPSKTITKDEIHRSTELITTRVRIEKNPWIFKEENFKAMNMGPRVAQASILRSFRSPVKGDWVIKIDCKDAKGLFTIENNGNLIKAIMQMPGKFVTGTITDTKNRPLSGVTVKIKGENVGTVTDDNGKFTIPIRDKSETIEIQYKKKNSKEIIVGDQQAIVITLDSQK